MVNQHDGANDTYDLYLSSELTGEGCTRRPIGWLTGRQINGNLACFCATEYDEIGDEAAEKEYQSTDGTGVTTCSEIFGDKASAALIKTFVSI